MNISNNQPADRRDDALDPVWERRLDRALHRDAEGHAPDAGLSERIFRATAGHLPGRAPAKEVSSAERSPAPAVAGRVGAWAWRSLAAALVLAGGVALLMLADERASSDAVRVIAAAPPASPLDVTQLEADLAALGESAWAGSTGDILDDQIDLLSMQLSWAGSDGVWAEDALTSLDKAITRETFDELADQIELIF